MAGRKLAVTVHVANPETGTTEVFRPGDDVPSWAAEAITNPDVWEGSKPDTTLEAGSSGEQPAKPRRKS